MNKYLHSVTLVSDKCHGCTHCLNFCPTEAIRIKNGKAEINADRCIDCGQCIRVCKNKAKKSIYDPIDSLSDFKFKVALPAPTIYGQFDNLDDIDYVVQGLYDIGFDYVYEVSKAAEIVSEYTRRFLKLGNIPKPVISSACPVILRLISLRFPSLSEHIVPIMSPMEVAAINARKTVLKEHPELNEDDIGIAFISPCPAKVSYVKNHPYNRKPIINAVLSMKEIYFFMISKMRRGMQPANSSESGVIGLSWATSGGESTAIFNEKFLAADGIDNVIKVLDQIENNALPTLEFVELNSCPGGCVGGVMTVANPFIAKARIQGLRRYLPVSRISDSNEIEKSGIPDNLQIHTPLCNRRIGSFSPDENISISSMARIQKISELLPQIDCGACGAPTCQAFAEDVVLKGLSIDDCPLYKLPKFSKKETLNESN